MCIVAGITFAFAGCSTVENTRERCIVKTAWGRQHAKKIWNSSQEHYVDLKSHKFNEDIYHKQLCNESGPRGKTSQEHEANVGQFVCEETNEPSHEKFDDKLMRDLQANRRKSP